MIQIYFTIDTDDLEIYCWLFRNIFFYHFKILIFNFYWLKIIDETIVCPWLFHTISNVNNKWQSGCFKISYNEVLGSVFIIKIFFPHNNNNTLFPPKGERNDFGVCNNWCFLVFFSKMDSIKTICFMCISIKLQPTLDVQITLSLPKYSPQWQKEQSHNSVRLQPSK